jgi:signal transduction histidine kinase
MSMLQAKPDASAAQTGKTILLVDDTAENLYATGSLLQPHFRVRIANGGAVALDVARRTPHPDIILLDIMMPEIDGYEVLRQLKAAPETADIPVIFVTAMDTDADEARGLALGAVDYITKPVVPALLLARVRTQLELKDARDWLKDRNTVLATEVARQVVELKAAKEAAEAASHSKSLFIDNMSHELRTPMNGVIGMLQLAQTEIPAGNPALEYLQVALDSSRAMVDQLTAILEYASIAHGEVSLHAQPLDIADMLEHASLTWRQRSEEKGLQFDLTRQPGTPEAINGDEVRLKRVLSILLSNAVKFTAHGKIELGVEAAQGGVHFWVSDTGIGIAADKQQGIFTPFEQADNSHTRQYGGAGLGLAIAIRLVELMGGRLWADSTPGAGSTFHVTLPEVIRD